MKGLAAQDRPREKLDRAGPGSLGENELLAIVIGHGSRGTDALAVANRVLATAGGVHGLTRMTLDELAAVAGMGTVMGGRILAAIELGRRTLVTERTERPRFASPREAAQFLLPQFGAGPTERFGVMLLDTKHRLIRTRVVSMGSIDRTPADPREVFREAVVAGAALVLVFHNHPSGDPTPSADDFALTRRLVSAGHVVGVEVADHLILADTRYYSMKEAEIL